MLASATDKELVQLSLIEKEAFGYIVDRYEAKLSRYIRRITRATEEDVADILQEVFIKAFVNLRGFDTSLPFSSWIYRITYNEVVSRHRKIVRRPEGNRQEFEDNDLSHLADSFSVEEEHDQSFTKEAISSLLDGLDIKYRQAIVLFYLEEKSYDEISDIMKKPPGTVATLLHRAKKKLKKLAQEHPALAYET